VFRDFSVIAKEKKGENPREGEEARKEITRNFLGGKGKEPANVSSSMKSKRREGSKI